MAILSMGVVPGPLATRILVHAGARPLLEARLVPHGPRDPRAVLTLAEALADRAFKGVNCPSPLPPRCPARLPACRSSRLLRNDGGTLTVNVLGSFVIGLVMGLSLERGLLGGEMRIPLTTGFCGGFTTMSTFSYETLAMLRDGQQTFALGNVGATFAACLAATWAGMVVARLL